MAKPYIVKRNELYCTWEEDISELPKNTVVLAGEGTRVIHYVNGSVEHTYNPDNNDKKSWLVVNTGAMRKRGDEAVVGVNDDKEFTIIWGIGGIPFTDRRLRVDTFVGMNGEFKFKVHHYPSLIGAIGKNNIVPKDVKEFTAAKLQETLCSKLAAKLKGKYYDDVMAMQSELSDEIRYDYEEELDSLGVKLTSFSLKEIFFPEDYLEKRAEQRDRGAAARAAFEEEDRKRLEKEREEEDAMRTLNMLRSASGSSYTQDNTTQASRYCPKCGKELASGAKFCDRCGAKL